MRTDYILYIIALICFIVAGYTAAYPFTDFMANTLIVIVLAIIGLIFIGSGYTLRPQPRVVTRAEPTIPPTKPTMEEQPMPPELEPTPEATTEPEITRASEPTPPTETTEEPKMEEILPPEAPPETTEETTTETKKPARRRRERKKA
jgi:hypothetical protein